MILDLCYCKGDRPKLPKDFCLILKTLNNFLRGINVQRNIPLLQAQGLAPLCSVFIAPHHQDDLQSSVHETVQVHGKVY